MDLKGNKMTINEALDILMRSVPDASIPNTALESSNKFIFDIAPESDETIFYDTLYSVDRKTGEVKSYNPLYEEGSFDIYKPVHIVRE